MMIYSNAPRIPPGRPRILNQVQVNSVVLLASSFGLIPELVDTSFGLIPELVYLIPELVCLIPELIWPRDDSGRRVRE